MSNEMINLPRLISLVAERTQVDPATARRFFHDFFQLIEQKLHEGEMVSIKGVGEFVNSGNPDHPVLYRPDDSLAAIANEPFNAFKAVELNDGAEEEITAASQPQSAPTPEPPAIPEPPVEIPIEAAPVEEPKKEPVAEPEPTPQPIETPAPEPVEIPIEEPKEEPKGAPAPTSTFVAPIPEPEPEEEEEPAPVYYQPRQQSQNGLWLVLGILIGLIIGLIGGYFAGKAMARYDLPEEEMEYLEDEATEEVDSILANDSSLVTEHVVAQPDATEETVEKPEEKVAEPAPAPAPEKAEPAKVEQPKAEAPAKPQPKYDTITKNRFLTTLAKEHYGVKNYWVFIYKANPQLGNPNHVTPGTKVLIPDKSSFAGKTKAETDAKAQKLMNEISKKYKL